MLEENLKLAQEYMEMAKNSFKKNGGVTQDPYYRHFMDLAHFHATLAAIPRPISTPAAESEDDNRP